MEMFDTHRRDILNFDNYMDLKKPGFGGPTSAISLRDAKGKLTNDKPKLAGYQHTVERDPAFSHPVYNSTYKAMTHDLVYKQEGKKPFTYDDPYHTAIPVIEIEPVEEGKCYGKFNEFINENEEDLEDEYEEFLEDEPEEPEYEYEPFEDSPEEEEEARAEASDFSRTQSDLRQIEMNLRKFETGGNFEEEEEFGANPEEEMSPFGPVPDWVKELRDK